MCNTLELSGGFAKYFSAKGDSKIAGLLFARGESVPRLILWDSIFRTQSNIYYELSQQSSIINVWQGSNKSLVSSLILNLQRSFAKQNYQSRIQPYYKGFMNTHWKDKKKFSPANWKRNLSPPASAEREVLLFLAQCCNIASIYCILHFFFES